MSNGNEHFIFVEHEPNPGLPAAKAGSEAGASVFKQVQVRTGASELGFTEITPLTPPATDAKVVVKGAYYLLSELTKGSGEHNH